MSQKRPSPFLFQALLIALGGLFSTSLTFAAPGTNLLRNGDAADGVRAWSNVSDTQQAPEINGRAFVISRGSAVTSQGIIPIDPSKTYRLSGSFRAHTEGAAALYLGVQCFDENREHIETTTVTIVPGTETTLSRDVAIGDSVVYIRDGLGWKLDTPLVQRSGAVAFAINPSQPFADLPNRNLSPRGLEGSPAPGGGWEVRLKGPLEFSFPAGTPVRLHRQGWGHVWPRQLRGVRLTTSWQRLSAELSGLVTHAGESSGFWPGTRYVRIVIQGECLATGLEFVELP